MSDTLYNKDDELETIVGFLTGSNALDGVWFGDSPEGKPRYWWRSKLKKAIASYGDQRELEGRIAENEVTHTNFDKIRKSYLGFGKYKNARKATLTTKKEK